MAVKEDTDLMIISQHGKIIRLESAEIRQPAARPRASGW